MSDTEGWITGSGTASSTEGQETTVQAGFEGRFWHTVDGGKTWTKEAIKDLSIQGLWMDGGVGYAVGITKGDGVTLLKYRTAPAADGSKVWL